MGKKSKTICEWEKCEIDENFAELVKLVRKPRCICKKCGRAAGSKKVLCKPQPIGVAK